MINAATTFPPTRDAALARLAEFVPQAGLRYAQRRNFDLGPEGDRHVSALSPYVRHRVITEAEVLRTILTHHSSDAAEKFIQEVIWRSYWKGWLEQRPTVWEDYKITLMAQHNAVQTQSGLRARWQAACLGDTGIDPFDFWARELARTGYLHNHARMWFASIWVFTLELPWELGADFFMRHLLDGDPASNTLGWRWVAGLHTSGKTYRADAENIAKFTQGRFTDVTGLATDVPAVEGTPNPERSALPASNTFDPKKRTGLILHTDDLDPSFLLDHGLAPIATLPLDVAPHSPWNIAPHVTNWTTAVLDDAVQRFGDHLGTVAKPVTTADTITRWAADNDLDQIVTAAPPVGPTASALVNSSVKQIRREYDQMIWPHATHGFFRLKKKISTFLEALDDIA